MLFKTLPKDIDYFVLNDHLYQTLQKNKQTKHLINLRAEEIVKSLLKESLETQIYQKYLGILDTLKQSSEAYQNLELQIERLKQKEEKHKKTLIKELKFENQQILIQVNAKIESRDEQISHLKAEIQDFEKKLAEIKSEGNRLAQQNISIKQQNQKLATKAAQLQQRNQQLKKTSKEQIQQIIFSHQEQMQKAFSKHKVLTNSINQLQSKLKTITFSNEQLTQTSYENLTLNNNLETQLKKSNRLIQKLKDEIKSTSENYSILKKQNQKLKQDYRQLSNQFNSNKQDHSKQLSEKENFIQNQNKQLENLGQELGELTLKNNKLLEFNGKIRLKTQKLQKIISISCITLKQQNASVRGFIKQILHSAHLYSEALIKKIVNSMSTELNDYFQECIFQIKKERLEKNLAKQQAKIKSDIIEQLDKMLNNETKSVYDLRYELKKKIREEQKLRKKLKHHYQQTDKKLLDFHSKYISILKSEEQQI